MPIYMDIHIVPGVKAKDVAEAHRLDLMHQGEHGCTCMTYWIDEQRESVFCLVEAPQKEAVEEMHRKAHGLTPNKIIEVDSSLVESFLGRIYDPENATVTDDGLKIFADSSFRILMVTKITDPVLLKHQLGAENAHELLSKHNSIIRKHIAFYCGSEAEHEGSDFVVSFTSASKAVACALAIQKELHDAAHLDLRMGINAGEPVEKSGHLFGDTIQLALNLCAIAGDCKIAVTSQVKELVSKDFFQTGTKAFLTLPPNDENFLELLFASLQKNWQQDDFDVNMYCREMAMSTSQLYRKTIALTGLSPNILLKEYRLEKAKDLMKKKRYSIAQITYDAGFTSASYFTKCFKKKYGLLPMAYVDLLH